MALVVTITVALLILGVLAYVVAQWQDPPVSKKKKEKAEPPAVVPAKDPALLTERFERKIRTLENSLQTAKDDVKEKSKEIEELKASIGGFERQLEQEKNWREKEESSGVKEKKLEKELRDELNKTRESLHEQSNQRIRLEYEVKELRLVKDALSGDLRKFTGQNNDLERRVSDFIKETRELKVENAKLRFKKEADEWVAKDDYVKVEKLLKRARWEVEQLQQRLPAELRNVE